MTTTEDLKFREFGLTESGRPQGLYLDDGGRQRPFLLKIEEDAPPGTPAYGYVMAMAKGFRIRQRRDTERILAAAYRRYRRAPVPAAAGEAGAEVEREDAETGAGFPRKLPRGATENG